jgi:cell division protein FtsQ
MLGEPLLFADTAGLGRELARDPELAAVRVTKQLPGTVRVTAARRVPLAVAAVPGGFALLGADGVVVDVLPVAPPSLPAVVVDGAPTTRGARADVALPALRALWALPPAVATRVVGLRVIAGGALEIELQGGVAVLFGAPDEEPARKGQVLEALMGYVVAKGWTVHFYNVVSPEAPAIVQDPNTERGSP